MIKYSIDRFEGETVVLVDNNECVVTVNRSLLPDGVSEGSILLFDGDQYVLSLTETKAKQAEVKNLIDELFV